MRIKKLWWVLLLIACAGGGLGYYRWQRSKGEANQPTYKNITANVGAIKISVLTTGSVQPENRLVIKPPINGRIEEAIAVEGIAVKKGQVLAWMSSTDRAALLDVARAKSPQELKTWEDMYRPTPIVAPLAGFVISRSVEPGQTVSTQDTTYVMSDHLIVTAQVDETDMAKVHLDQVADITLDAYPNERLKGKVTHIAYEARTVSNVTVYDVQVTPIKVPPFMRSGMTANVEFLVAEKSNVIVIPAGAIRYEEGKAFVTLPTADAESGKGQLQSSEIQTGLTDGKQVEVVSGLRDGQEILQPQFNRGGERNAGSNPFMPMGGKRPKR